MAFSDQSLAVSAANPTIGTGTLKTFNRILMDATGYKRRETLSTSADPYDMVVRHQVIMVGANKHPADRHLLQLVKINHDAANVEQQLIVNLTVQKPHATSFTNADVQSRLAIITNLLFDGGNLDAFLRGE